MVLDATPMHFCQEKTFIRMKISAAEQFLHRYPMRWHNPVACHEKECTVISIPF